MNISIRSTVLAQELRLMSKIVPSKATVPILNYVLLRTENEGLTLAATNMNIWFYSSCMPNGITTAGETTLPIKKTLELLEQVPDMDVTIAVVDQHATITAGAFKSRVQTMPADLLPLLPNVEGDMITFPAAATRRLIECTAYAIPDNPDKYVIDGVLLSLNGAIMAMVATDGKRLTMAAAAKPDGANLEIVIPSTTLNLLKTFLTEGDVEFIKGENHIFFKVGPRTLISRMIDGRFPKYQKIIPVECDKNIKMDRALLMAALRRVLVMADETSTVVDFLVEHGHVRLTSRSTGYGDADEEVQAEYEGATIRVSASGKHVLDFLDHATEQTVSLAFKGESSPMLWTDGVSDFLNVILVRK
jgi:DNA polymerase-3 subunit beta